jgi:hypothetical protein
MRARLVGGIGVAVLVALGALATGSFQRREEPGARVLSPSMTSLPSTTPAPREFRALAGVPLTQGTRLRLLVASDPTPFVFDLDRANVQPVAGLPTDGERVVSVLPVGEQAVIVSQRVCTSCRPPAGEVYGLWRRSTTAVRLGTAQEIVAARDGRAVWLLSHRTVNACTLREVGLDGRLRRTRPVSCASKLLGELPAAEMLAANGQLLLTGAEPLAPLTLTNLRSGNSWRLSWPSRLRGGTHIASVHPDGRHIAVGFYGLAAPGEEGRVRRAGQRARRDRGAARPAHPARRPGGRGPRPAARGRRPRRLLRRLSDQQRQARRGSHPRAAPTTGAAGRRGGLQPGRR